MKSTHMRVAPLVMAMLLALIAAPAAAGERMSGADIEAYLGGVTLDGVYATGDYFTETYRENGTVRYWDAVSADSGEWSVQDDQFCTFYESNDGACFTVERDGANCFTFYEKDPKTNAIDPKKWTSRGWIRGHDNTCPKIPEAKL